MLTFRMVKDFLPNGLVSLAVLSGMSCFRFESPRERKKHLVAVVTSTPRPAAGSGRSCHRTALVLGAGGYSERPG
jgi:hypothetical protein